MTHRVPAAKPNGHKARRGKPPAMALVYKNAPSPSVSQVNRPARHRAARFAFHRM